MEKNISKNYFYNLLFQIITVLFPIITTPYLARILGAEKIGIFSYTLSIITYFVLMSSLGISLYGQREIAYIQDDKIKISQMFNNLFFVKTITTLFSILIYIIFIFATKEYKIYYVLWIIELIANLFDISWFYQGQEQFKKIIMKNFIIKILSTILIFLFVKNTNDLYIYIIIYTCANLFGNLSLWLNINKEISFNFFSKNNFLNLKLHLKNLLIFFIPQLATKIYTVLDKTMIGIIAKNKYEVAYYEQAQKIIYLVLTILTSLGIVMMPRIANLFATKKEIEIYKSIKKSLCYVMMIGFPLTIGTILVSKFFIPLYLGPEYNKSIILMQLLSPIIIIVGLSNVTGIQILIPLNKQKEYNISVVFGALVNVILNSILIKNFSSVGAVVSTVISELIILCVQIHFVKKSFKLTNIFKYSFNYIFSTIIMFITCSFLMNYIKFNNFIMFFIIAIAGFVIYTLMLFLLKDELALIIKNKIKFIFYK